MRCPIWWHYSVVLSFFRVQRFFFVSYYWNWECTKLYPAEEKKNKSLRCNTLTAVESRIKIKFQQCLMHRIFFFCVSFFCCFAMSFGISIVWSLWHLIGLRLKINKLYLVFGNCVRMRDSLSVHVFHFGKKNFLQV